MKKNEFDRRKFIAAGAAGAGGALLSGCAVFDLKGWQAMIGDNIGTGTLPLPELGNGDPAEIDENWVTSHVRDFLENDPSNSHVGEHKGEPIFKDALVGFAAGDDSIFEQYKTIIGQFHQTPREAMEYMARAQGVDMPAMDRVSVISYIFPLTDKVVQDNAAEDRWTSKRWVQGRLYGGMFCTNISASLLNAFAERGVLAVVPDRIPAFRVKRDSEVGYASNWSQRHIAFAAGMGSFGMNDFFISEMGTACRHGSIVVARPLKPNRQRPPHYRHHCLHHQTGGCLICAERCPVGATSEAGHDKNICGKNVMGNVPRNQLVHNVNCYGCGLCATDTPCAQEMPV